MFLVTLDKSICQILCRYSNIVWHLAVRWIYETRKSIHKCTGRPTNLMHRPTYIFEFKKFDESHLIQRDSRWSWQTCSVMESDLRAWNMILMLLFWGTGQPRHVTRVSASFSSMRWRHALDRRNAVFNMRDDVYYGKILRTFLKSNCKLYFQLHFPHVGIKCYRKSYYTRMPWGQCWAVTSYCNNITFCGN